MLVNPATLAATHWATVGLPQVAPSGGSHHGGPSTIAVAAIALSALAGLTTYVQNRMSRTRPLRPEPPLSGPLDSGSGP